MELKVIGFYKSHPDGRENVLCDVEIPKPVAADRDLLVRIRAAAINPVDVKTRNRVPVGTRSPTILGYDASGTVEAVGSGVRGYKAGDAVFYAGSITRPGSYAEFQLVDERIVGKKPASLSFAEAAALPLTSITAWEMLFHRLAVPTGQDRVSLLVIAAAGGVGSMAIQLARCITRLTVIATASRPAGREW
jgi:zinc-binding alcohol dehydrogenase family protein